LREFVQTGFAKKLTEGYETLFVGQQIAISVAIACHSAKLVEIENATVFTGTRLAEKDWPAHADVNGDRHY
jgi:hypothetical protein